jgi:type V secretory pathway adhesin AidA
MKKSNFKKLNNKNAIVTLIVVMFSSVLSLVYSQDVVLSSGGEAIGTDGVVNYSVGQIVQNTLTSDSGSVAQGIQFYFDTETLTIIDPVTNLQIETYPNPTTSILNLRIDGLENRALSYKLFNLLGITVSKGRIANANNTIDLEDLPSATYMLQVIHKNKAIKTFKIIKN